MQIFIETVTRQGFEQTAPLDVKASDTIASVKVKIHTNEVIGGSPGWPPLYRQRLTFTGRLLEDGRTLADCNILDGTTLHLALRAVQFI